MKTKQQIQRCIDRLEEILKTASRIDGSHGSLLSYINGLEWVLE